MLREWILAVSFAVSAALFAVGAGFEWGVGVALMIGAALLAGWSLLVVRDDSETEVSVEDANAEPRLAVVPTSKRTVATAALAPSEMKAFTLDDEHDKDVG